MLASDATDTRMTAAEFVGLATELIFLVILAVVVVRAVRLRTGPSTEIAAFFGLIVASQQLGNILDLLDLEEPALSGAISWIVVSALPYMLLRMANLFTPLGRPVMLAGLAATTVIALIGVVVPVDRPNALNALVVGWFAVGGGYASLTFMREAGRAPGVTARRLTAAAVGSTLIALALVLAVIGLVLPAMQSVVQILVGLMVMMGAVAYYIGFATPTWLRRAWQEPAVRMVLANSADLTSEPDETRMVRRLQSMVARAVGTPTAVVALASADGGVLRYLGPDDAWAESPSDRWLAGRAFTTGRPVFSANPAFDDAENAEGYRASGTETVIAAPIVSGDRTLGALVAYAPRQPLFALSDLELTEALGRQTGSILQSRELLRDAAAVHAREAAARAKEDFLSAAAHDLRTPLSSLILRIQLMARRMTTDGSPHREAILAAQADAQRVVEFVDDLLDAARAEYGRLSAVTQPVELVELARKVAAEHGTARHKILVDGQGSVVEGDPRRLEQVLDNLVGNAVKYSPDGGEVRVEVRTGTAAVMISVVDDGIGVDPADLPDLFDRFTRGRNVDDRRFRGLGLGLYISRRIVEEHGGRIWAESQVGHGTSIRVELPLSSAPQGDVPHG